jgi:hypothetical protein
MNFEGAMQRLRAYRTRNERFDRLVGAVMSNEVAARGVRRAVSVVASASAAGSRLAARGRPEGPMSVFFIVGQARSGTTWVRNTLGAHPEILCRGEGRFFERSFLREDFEGWDLKNIAPVSLYGAFARSEYLRAWTERSVWATGRTPDEHLDNLTRLAVDYFLSEQLAGTGKRIVGDKTPFASPEFVTEISRLYPEARVVHIIRDGRDMAVSRIHHMWSYAKSEGGIYDLSPDELRRRDAYRAGILGDESLFEPGRLARVAADWRSGVGQVVEEGPVLLGERYAEIRYEDLLAEPETGVRGLLEFLGARSGEAVVRRCVEAASFERGSANRKRGEEDSTSRNRKGIAGDWKNVLTQEDRRSFKEAAGDLLIRLGYEEDNDW